MVAGFFDAQADEVARLIEAEAGLHPDMLLQAGWDDALKAEAGAALARLALEATTRELAQAPSDRGVRIEVKAEDTVAQVMEKLPPAVRGRVEAFIKDALAQPWWSELTGQVRDDLGTALKEALDAGDSLHRTAKRVQATLKDCGKKRAETIVRTEATGALNAGAAAAREHLHSLGLLKGVQWLCVLDGSTRLTHRALNGQTVNVGEEFDLGNGLKARYPGDQRLPPYERVNCRCTTISVLKSVDELGV